MSSERGPEGGQPMSAELSISDAVAAAMDALATELDPAGGSGPFGTSRVVMVSEVQWLLRRRAAELRGDRKADV